MSLRPIVTAACAAFLFQACVEPPPPEPDAGEPDSGTPDAGEPDSGTPDAGPPDGGGGNGACGGRPCNEGWSLVTQPFAGEVMDISTTAPDNVWVLATGQLATEYTAHWNGTAWTTTPLQTASTGAISADGIWTAGQDIAFIAGRSVETADYYSPRTFHFDGGSWEPIPVSGPVGTPLLDLWGSFPTDLWTVGYDHFLHGDGTSWAPVTAPLPSSYDLDAISGTAPDNVWTVGKSSGRPVIVLRLDGGTWEDVSPALTGFYQPTDIWVAGRDEAWIAVERTGGATSFHRKAGAWTEVAVDGGAYAVWGAAPDDVWFAGQGGLSHWDGQQMSQVDLDFDVGFLWGVAGSGPGDVWAWGEQTTIHYQR